MLSREIRVPMWVVMLCMSVGAIAYTHTAMGESKKDSRSGSQRINDRLTKDADDHLKSNLSDEDKRQALKKELVRAAAMADMAETLSKDPKFQQAYGTLITASAKRSKDVMPDDGDIEKEESGIINDPEGTRKVMAMAMLKLQKK